MRTMTASNEEATVLKSERNFRLRVFRRALTLCVAVALAATSGLFGDPTHAARSRNRLAQNRLAQNRLASNRLAQNRLATNALSSTRLEANLATAEILKTAEGRELYSYLISCALPGTVTLEAAIPDAPDAGPGLDGSLHTCIGGKCTFPGSLGLAPDWVDHKLSSKDERWVSACMLARVNLFITTEAISLRGNHPGLAVSIDEVEIYNVAEGAFYGNIFTH